MTRTISTATQEKLTAASLEPVILVDFDFASAPVRLWSGIGEIEWDSVTWTGSGDLVTLEAVEETSEINAKGVRFQLSGIPADMLSLALQEEYQGRDCLLYLGVLNETTKAIVEDPILMFKGYMDVMSFEDQGETANIQMNVENRLIALERANELLYTGEQQKLTWPSDKGFDFVVSLQDIEVVWGD